MRESDIAVLQQSEDKLVRLYCTDGEQLVAKIILADMQNEEIVFELISTTDESKYEKFDRQPAYLIHFQDITSIEPVESGRIGAIPKK